MTKTFLLYTRGLLFNERKEILLIRKRMDQKQAPGKWIFPGGTCEWGEDVEEALKRELKEEICANVTYLKLIGTRKLMIGEIHWQGIYYKVTIDNASELKNREPHKHEEIRWYPLDSLPVDMDEIDRKHIEMATRED